MKLSTLLLSSAALVVAGSAFAADLPAKKGAPAKSVAGCPAFGVGYFQIPGSDTCLQIGGFVRANTKLYTSSKTRSEDAYTMAGAAYFWLDAKNNSEVGVVHSYIAAYGDGYSTFGVDEAYLEAAGLSGGLMNRTTANLDITGGTSTHGMLYSDAAGALRYSVPMGSSSLTIGMEQAATNSEVDDSGSDITAIPSSRPDLTLAMATKAGGVSVNVAAVSHDNPGAVSGSTNGYALIGNASVDMGGAVFKVYGGYADGYSYLINNGSASIDATDNADASSKGSIVAAAVDVPMGANKLSFVAIQSQITDAVDDKTTTTKYGVAYKAGIAKGLWVRPEYYRTEGGDSYAYLRIQRDF